MVCWITHVLMKSIRKWGVEPFNLIIFLFCSEKRILSFGRNSRFLRTKHNFPSEKKTRTYVADGRYVRMRLRMLSIVSFDTSVCGVEKGEIDGYLTFVKTLNFRISGWVRDIFLIIDGEYLLLDCLDQGYLIVVWKWNRPDLKRIEKVKLRQDRLFEKGSSPCPKYREENRVNLTKWKLDSGLTICYFLGKNHVLRQGKRICVDLFVLLSL